MHHKIAAATAAVTLIAGLSAATSVLAHHSYAMFDRTKTATMNGTVRTFQWTNPHAYIEVDATAADGKAKHWSVELGSPSILIQGGWKHSTLKKGMNVSLTINPSAASASAWLFAILFWASAPQPMRGSGRP